VTIPHRSEHFFRIHGTSDQWSGGDRLESLLEGDLRKRVKPFRTYVFYNREMLF
jgi:hypothetical protein